MVNGWETSADAWIADIGERGDYAREFILDPPMLARARTGRPGHALDVGCGEGRFCRMLASAGHVATGLDPTRRMIEAATDRGGGRFVQGRAEAMPFADASFDFVVSYLSLVDIEDIDAALDECRRVLRPGGRLLIANLSGYASALPERSEADGWLRSDNTAPACEAYHRPRAFWISWRGIRVRNWHRPLQTYLQALLGRGFRLTHFEEPVPVGGPAELAERYTHAPVFVVMEWEKPA